MSVSAADISFVIQGPFREEVPAAIASVRRYFPAAEVIFSTWIGSDVPALDIDFLVESRDPGQVRWQYNENLNRQIVSTRAGLAAATRRFAVKMRTDCRLEGDGFARLDLSAVPRNPGYSLFRERIVCPARFTRNPARWPLLFHPSDMFHFGRREDLLDLWSIPPVGMFLVNKELRITTSTVLVPEQYIFRTFLASRGIALPPVGRRPGLVSDGATSQWRPETLRAIELSNAYLTQNFWVEEDQALGLSYSDRGSKGWAHLDTNFTPEEWRRTALSYAPTEHLPHG